ncbi:hypothetical protein HDA39_004848 [Kribbella italica]|uniref:Uncharacterized protein n=1 Tax=Kribbella italica TaxID=1540520 RepID=A0A7W9J9K7_9ACTN|nr:hypothetical protein [Kribbella italica]
MQNHFTHGHRKSKGKHDFPWQVDHRELGFGRNHVGDQMAAGGRLVREFSRHGAAEAAASETSSFGFAYCFFGGPEVEEGLGVGGRLRGGEPAAGERLDGEVPAELDVDAYRACVGGGYSRDAGGVGEGDVEAFDHRLAGGGVRQGVLVAEGRGEVAEQVVGGFVGGFGAGAHPDVNGFRCGARGFIHREKVTR